MTDYTFYSSTYLAGKEAVIDATSFPFWERKACQEVRKYTFGNINESQTIPDTVKICVCEVAEILFKQDKADKHGIVSEKVGEYSVSYVNKSDIDKKREIYQTIVTCLAGSGYLYSGVM